MKTKIRSLFFLIFFVACGGGGTPSSNGEGESQPTQNVSNKKILASNVLFSTAQAEETEGIDTETKVYAENVILVNSTTSLESTNVQDAFEEIQPDLSTLIVGTWKLTYLGTYCDSGLTCDATTITFNSDGTLSEMDLDISFSKSLTLYPGAAATVVGIYPYLVVNNAEYHVLENIILYIQQTYSFYQDENPENQTINQETRSQYEVIKFTSSKIVTNSFVLTKIE